MELDQIKSLKNMIDFADEHFAGEDFIRYKVDGGLASKTYAQLKCACDAFSRMLEAKQLKGAHVAVVGPTCFEWIVTYLGTVNSNSVIIPLAANESTEMNCKLMDFVDTDVFVFDKAHVELYHAVKSSLSNIRFYISLDGAVEEEGVISFADIIEEFAGVYNYEPDENVMCTILLTSGTTGFPKGVMLSHRNLVSAAMSVNENCTARSVLSCLPIHHAFCFNTNFLKLIFRGATACINDNLMNLLADIRLFSPDSIVVVPQLAKKLMEGAIMFSKAHPEFPVSDAVHSFLGNSGKIISGGAPLDATLSARYNGTGMLVLNGYGMSECAPCIANNTPNDYRHGSVGKPIPCVQTKIENGELLVKGDNVMLGYYKNPEATKEAFTDDGWMHTGDLGHFDEDGYLYITGRCKNLILLDNGENVSAEFLEERFSSEPLVAEVVVYGEDGAICAELFLNHELMQKQNITDIDAEMMELLSRVNNGLPPHQRISTYVIRDIPFERTASQKIKRISGKPSRKAPRVEPKTPAEVRVCNAVREILLKDTVGTNENFFAIGGDSLSAAELAVSLHVNTQVIYDNPFLSSLALVVEKTMADEDMVRPDVNGIIKASTDERVEEYKCVLLTGATGFLGAHILKELTERNVKTICLVRNSERFLSQLEYYFDDIDISNVTVIKGNIENTHLGLSADVYNSLASQVDAVFHVAANVHHAGDYLELKKTNVEGTQNVIDFAKAANAVLHHTSTVSVHGSATVVQENRTAVFDEFTLNIGQHFYDNVYIHSKYHAEEAVLLARQEGLKSNIYRIGNLTWRASDGKFQRNNEENGFLSRVRAMMKLGMLNDNMDTYPMDLTAVDECAKAFVSLAFAGHTNEIYHLYNPNYLKTAELFNALGRQYKHVSTLETIETVFANTDDRDIRVYLFYMIISGRSAYIDTRCTFTVERMAEVGFEWSKPDGRYMNLGGHCTDFDEYEVKPMRTCGGALTPIQKIAFGGLQDAQLGETELFTGEASLSELAERVSADGVSNPLVVTFNAALNFENVKTLLSSFGKYTAYTSINGEPTVEDTENCLLAYQQNDCDGVVAIGGGSVIDCAKITALCAANTHKQLDDLNTFAVKANRCVPFYVVPTTAGTGSESTVFAVITDTKEHKKKAFASDKFMPYAVALDASLTLSVPEYVTACTAIDALSHAVEAYVSTFGVAFEQDRKLALVAARKIFSSLEKACNNLDDIAARTALLEASHEAGVAFRRISTGYIHALAHRLGELYNLPHGAAIASVFTSVLRANMPEICNDLASMAVYCGICEESANKTADAEKFIAEVDRLIACVGIDKKAVAFNEADAQEIVLRAQEEVKVVGYPKPFSDESLTKLLLDNFR